MNFANVQKLVIPEGEVVRISHGTTVLWERPGLPLTYQQVEYIQTDGNQYIDTGVNASKYPDGLRYVFRGNVTKYQNTSFVYWFGALANGSRSGNLGSVNGQLQLMIGAQGTYGYIGALPTAGQDFDVIMQASSKYADNCTVSVNGVTLAPSGTMTSSEMPNANIYLFTAYGTGALNTAGQKYYGKLYSFTMDGVDGTPIRNFVPCYRKSDGVIGLYDTVGGVFYTNKGTGSFTKGADV